MKKSTAYALCGILTLGSGVYMKSKMNPEFNFDDYFAGRDFRAELDARQGKETRLWDMSEEEYRARKEIERKRQEVNSYDSNNYEVDE